jgi:GNAT superfamily N-acetyltransferase
VVKSEMRRARREDAKILLPLFELYRRFYGRESDLAGGCEFLQNRLTREEAVIFFVAEAARGLGFTLLYPSFSSLALRRTWILNDLFVLPEARGRGLGRQLLQRAAEFCRETGARGMTLKTAGDNVPAQRLYESEGWKRDRHFLNYDWEVD